MEGSARTGLLVVGLGGVGSSLIAGVLAARAHLVHPFGSLVEAGGTGRVPGSPLSALRERAPLAELAELELGGQVALYLAPGRWMRRCSSISRRARDAA